MVSLISWEFVGILDMLIGLFCLTVVSIMHSISIAQLRKGTWLWNTMVRNFEYDRKETGTYPEIYASNAIIGNFLRLDLLDRYGLKDTLYDNIKGYFEYMANITGTLWEHIDTHASCNRGFASLVVYWMKSMGLVVMD